MTRQRLPGVFPERIGPGLTNGPAAGEQRSPSDAAGALHGEVGGLPRQPFHHLDALWLQVAGTRCNLSCTHCFVTCGPHEQRHGMMSRAEVATRVAEAIALGVREIYLTGGEPFLHRELEGIVLDTLAVAPVTVLTNGTLFTPQRVRWLASATRLSRYSLELRVSLDGTDAEAHDAFRGAGAWRRTMDGLRALRSAGLLPIVTLTRSAPEDAAALAARARAALAAERVEGSRLKLLPMFTLGRETARPGHAPSLPSLASLPPGAFDDTRLQCGSCRAVTSRGVFVCPLLVDEPGGRLGDTLAESARPFALAHAACATCWATGMTCAND